MSAGKNLGSDGRNMMSKNKWLPEIEARVNQVKSDLVLAHKTCGGTGYHMIEGRGQRRCMCMTVFHYIKELIKSNIPQDYWSLEFKDLALDEIVRHVVSGYRKNIIQAHNNGLGLVLFGQNGTGKTSVMAEIAKRAVIKGYQAKYFTLSSYVDAMFKKDAARVEYYESGDFLLIDELDKKSGTSAIYKLVDEFLRRMFNMNKSLILGTNWDTDELKEHLGESTFSLLKRRCEFLEFQGEDFSDNLQDSYIDRLDSKYDFFTDSIIDHAWILETRHFGNEE
jgi:DNA replication protein DnaC